MIRYIKYFIYCARTYNLRFAIQTIFSELSGELRYGINTTGISRLNGLASQGIDITNCVQYMPISYNILESTFENIEIGRFHHLVDLGCGKGRPLCVAARKGVKKLTGVDISSELCHEAKLNLEKHTHAYPSSDFRIVNIDVRDYSIPDDMDCLLLYHPFKHPIVSVVIEKIELSLARCPREILVLYFSPVCRNLFLNAGFRQTSHQTVMRSLSVSVLQRQPQ